jgi:hypothetical protein
VFEQVGLVERIVRGVMRGLIVAIGVSVRVLGLFVGHAFEPPVVSWRASE